MRTPRRAGVLAAVAASAAVAVGGASAAVAAPAAPSAPTAPTVRFCPASAVHPTTAPSTSTNPTPTVSSTQPVGGPCVIKLVVTVYFPGGSITFTAYYFLPFERGRVFVRSTQLQVGTFQANANGVVTGTVKLPANFPVGQHTLELVGNEGTVISTPFTVVAPGATGTGSGSGSGTLPFTGADVVGLAGGGMALVVGGALLTVVFRRRRAIPAA